MDGVLGLLAVATPLFQEGDFLADELDLLADYLVTALLVTSRQTYLSLL